MLERRSLLKAGGLSALAVGALLAVESGITPAEASTTGLLTPTERKHLKIFDELDFDVFSNKKWDRVAESHSPDVVVHWPDGHVTEGLAKHIADMQQLVSYIPDVKITEHPLKVALGDLTAVTGIMTGTWSRPLQLPDGSSIPPSNKSFTLGMCTVGRWNRHGVMNEEFLFMDNLSFAQQLGLPA